MIFLGLTLEKFNNLNEIPQLRWMLDFLSLWNAKVSNIQIFTFFRLFCVCVRAGVDILESFISKRICTKLCRRVQRYDSNKIHVDLISNYPMAMLSTIEWNQWANFHVNETTKNRFGYRFSRLFVFFFLFIFFRLGFIFLISIRDNWNNDNPFETK